MHIDSLKTAKDTAQFILESIYEINKNTDGFSTGLSTAISVVSIIASVATIIGLVSLFLDIQKRKTNYNFRKKIILDLIRHMMVNNAIIEVIYSKITQDPNYRPDGGVLHRFATLDSDVDLCRFSINSKNYELIHNLSLNIRNYNLVAISTDKHIQSKDTSSDKILKELDDIFFRGVEISKNIIDVGDNNKYSKLKLIRNKRLSNIDIKDYIAIVKYNEDWVQKRIDENRYIDTFVIPKHDTKSKPYYNYYEELELTDVFNHLIRHNAARF